MELSIALRYIQKRNQKHVHGVPAEQLQCNIGMYMWIFGMIVSLFWVYDNTFILPYEIFLGTV